MNRVVYKTYLGLLYGLGSFPLLKILSIKQIKTRHLQVKSKAMCLHALKA